MKGRERHSRAAADCQRLIPTAAGWGDALRTLPPFIFFMIGGGVGE